MEKSNSTFQQELDAFAFDLEVVHERSIESENTYKTSLVETEPNRSNAKLDNFFGEHRLVSKKGGFNPSATVHLEKQINISELDPKFTPDTSPFKERLNRMEERISSKDKLILQMKIYQNELTEAYESLKKEYKTLKSNLDSNQENNYQNDNPELDELKQDLDTMAQEIEFKENKILKLKGKYKVTKKNCMQLSEELAKAKSQISSLQKEKEQISNKLAPLFTKATAEKYDALIQDLEYKHHQTVVALEESLKKALNSQNKNINQDSKLKGTKREFSLRELQATNTQGGQIMFSSQIRSNSKKLPDVNKQELVNKQFTKFAEACTDLMMSCQGEESRKQPSLKQVWRWLKGILEEFLVLKKVSRELEEMFQTSNYDEIILICEDLLMR